MDAPPAQVPRGGYTQNAPLSASHHRSEEYDPAYPGSSRAHSYSAQTRPAPNAPVSHGGVSHDAHASRGGVRGGAPSQQWAPSPREPSYGGTPHGSGTVIHAVVSQAYSGLLCACAQITDRMQSKLVVS